MRLLDLFCGAGGAAMGYHRAGFDEIVGVDIKPQPRYPFNFVQADALEFGASFGAGFDAIHASPPCQAHIKGGLTSRDGRHKDLIPQTKQVLRLAGRPFVIENVPGAPLVPSYRLCGSMFGLPLRRHRTFESSHCFSLAPFSCDHSHQITGVYGKPCGKRGAWRGMIADNRETWSTAMGIDWMTTAELAQAIPPAYTEFIGRQLLEALKS